MEFTIEQNIVYFLQTRVGKRTAAAAAKPTCRTWSSPSSKISCISSRRALGSGQQPPPPSRHAGHGVHHRAKYRVFPPDARWEADSSRRRQADMQDMEFTIEQNIVYFLQTRVGKRTAAA